MAAVLCVKRRFVDEPLSTLAISCKRPKLNNEEAGTSDSQTSMTTVLQFAATLKNQNEDVDKHIKNVLQKEELEMNFKRYTSDVLNRMRNENKTKAIENRYKILNSSRLLDTSDIEEFTDSVITVIDVEDSLSCNASNTTAPIEENDYVYDLYFAKTANPVNIDGSLSVYTLDNEFSFDALQDNNGSDDDGDSEDSNDENHWRNDYPEEESDHSVNEDDMEEAMGNLEIGEDLSSDEDFVHEHNNSSAGLHDYLYAEFEHGMVDRSSDSSENEHDEDNSYDENSGEECD